jgi:hypothetical protein
MESRELRAENSEKKKRRAASGCRRAYEKIARLVAELILRNKRGSNKVPGKHEAEEGARIGLSMQQT